MKFHLVRTEGKSPFYYVCFSVNGKRKHLSTKETNKKLATQKARVILMEYLDLASQSPLERKTLNEAIEIYSKKAKTENSTKSYFRFWKTHLGKELITDITQEQLDSLRDLYQEERQCKAQSVNRAFTPMYALLNMCKEKKWTTTSYHHKKLPKENVKKRRTITDAEFKKILEACKESGNEFLCDPLLFYMNTGFRKEELVNLKREDVERDSQSVTLRAQKNGTINQQIKLNSVAWQIVLRNLLKSNQEYLFSGRGRNGSLGDFKKAWTTVRRIAGISDIDIHSIRHTAIMKVASAPECNSEYKLRQFSRHKSSGGLEAYLHELNKEKLLETMELASWGQEFVSKLHD